MAPPPKVQFQFVAHESDQGALDARSRRTVRSHVMKGRNNGKKLPTRSVVKKVDAETTVLAVVPAPKRTAWTKRRAVTEMGDEEKEKVQRRRGKELVTFVGLSPARMDDIEAFAPDFPLTRHDRLQVKQFFLVVVEALFPKELCQCVEHYELPWFQQIFADEAYLHAIVALATASVDFLLGGVQEESPASLLHLSRCFRLVTAKLSTAHAVSDDTLALVSILACYETLRGKYKSVKVHLDGLRRMVDIRGGLANWTSGSSMTDFGGGAMSVRSKICRLAAVTLCLEFGSLMVIINVRPDIEYSLETGEAPLFSHDSIPRDLIPWGLRDVPSVRRSPLLAVFADTSPEMRQIVVDILNVDALFNNVLNADEIEIDSGSTSTDDYDHDDVEDGEKISGQRRYVTPIEFQDITQSLLYRLMIFDDYEAAQLDDVQRSWFVGLMAFMSSFMYQLGRREKVRYPRIAVRLQASVERLEAETNSSFALEEERRQNLGRERDLNLYQGSDSSSDSTMLLWLLFIGRASVWGEQTDSHWVVPMIARTCRRMGLKSWAEVRAQLNRYPWVACLHDEIGQLAWGASRRK